MSRGGSREGAGRKSAFPGEDVKAATFKLPVAMLEELAARADVADVSQAGVVGRALRELFEREPRPSA